MNTSKNTDGYTYAICSSSYMNFEPIHISWYAADVVKPKAEQLFAILKKHECEVKEIK